MSSGLLSMTGYGTAAASVDGWPVLVECRSVNHRGLDVRVRVPGELRWIESQIQGQAKEKLQRGRVEVRVDLEAGEDAEGYRFDEIDEERFAAVANTLNKLAHANRLAAASLQDVLEYRSFFEKKSEEVFAEESSDALIEIVDQALEAMIESRAEEGRGIASDMRGNLQTLARNLEKVAVLREEDQAALRSRVQARLRQTLQEFEVGDVDESRVAQELAFFVEKGDIAEELQRADSHIRQLSTIIASTDGKAMGKKIDFYLQELVRETNTMGSKSQHSGLTDCVIEMKNVVEKMREQAANIE